MSSRNPTGAAADVPSPSPSTMPPPNNNNKRPRPSGPTASGGGGGGGRAKRAKKVEEPSVASDDDMGGSGAKNEDGEVQTKIDFRDLPDDTLYKYLEMHQLLPTWLIQPWSESAMQRPSELYLDPPTDPVRPPSPSRSAPVPASASRPSNAILPSASASSSTSEIPSVLQPIPLEPTIDGAGNGAGLGIGEEDENENGRATRSKTRKDPTPPPPAPQNQARMMSSEVVTLSDVLAAREVLAEKANQHWAKGLGGGQNKESETIVHFLYKLKVGPGIQSQAIRALYITCLSRQCRALEKLLFR